MPLPLTNPFAIVGACLAPGLSGGRREALDRALGRGAPAWEALLATANRHACTPLWYVRLRDHGLLGRLPRDLAAYLGHLHAANRARNSRLRAELAGVVDLLGAAGIPVLLLKGAAAFVDRLYPDPGARMMADLDLLVPEDRCFGAQARLKAEGWREEPGNTSLRDPAPFNAKHAHLPSLHHPEQGITLELHYKVAYGQAGRVLDTGAAWQASRAGELDGRPVRRLDPSRRLLHQALHATQPHAEWIRGAIRLADLAECAALMERDGTAPALRIGTAAPADRLLARDLAAYAGVARRVILGAEAPGGDLRARWHAWRIGGRPGTGCGRGLALAYHGVRFPGWLLRNVAYGRPDTLLPQRLAYLGGKLRDAASREKLRGYGIARSSRR